MSVLRSLCLSLASFTCLMPTAARAQLVINEVDADQSGTDSQEFVEIYDGGAGNTSLDGFVLVLYNGSDDASYEVIDLAGQVTTSQGFFVVGNPDVPNVGLVVDPGGSGAFQNGPDGVALYQASADSFPNDTPITTDGLIDALVYGTNDDDDFDLLDGLTPGEIQVNDTREESMSRLPDGGDPFASSTYGLQAPSPGFANVVTESLTVSLSVDSISESAGADATEVTVMRTGSTEFAAVVTLSLIDFTEALVPAEVTIPAGADSASVFIEAVDDAWADGTQVLTLGATSPGLMEMSIELEVTDDATDPVGLVINEFYPDDQDDANEDGEGDSDGPGKDEFIEFVNVSEAAIDLSDHTLNDMVASRHRFPAGTVVEPGCALVVFGGGDVIEGNNPMFGGATVQLANDSNEFGLGLNNSGDFIRLLTPDGVEIVGLRYDATNGDSGSRVREPDLTGDFVFHIDVVDSPALFTYTPGFSVLAEPFCALTLELSASVEPNMISEDAGANASVLTLTRTGATDEAITVSLSNGDPSEIDLPTAVEIPAGAESITVPIGAVNDAAQDGDIVVTITATAAEFLNGTTQIQVLDDGDAPAMIVINELDADQPGDEIGEFVELYDGGVGNIPLDGFVLVLFNGANGNSYASYDLDGSSTTAEGFFVIGDAEVPNVDLGINNFTLQNGADAVALYRGDRSDFPSGSFALEDGLVDAVAYGTDDDEAVDLLDVLTPDQAQINEGSSNNTTSIGREGEGGDPRNTSTFGTMVPSPGAPNGSVQEQGPSYDRWAGDFADLGGPDVDTDGDGFSNALEYALDSNPLVADGTQQLGVEIEDGKVVVSVPLQDTFPPGVTVTFERSGDMQVWETIDTAAGSLVDGAFRVQFSEALTEPPAAFIRVGATVTP